MKTLYDFTSTCLERSLCLNYLIRFYTHLFREVFPLERFRYVIGGVRPHGGQLETNAVVHQDQLQVEVLDRVPHCSC